MATLNISVTIENGKVVVSPSPAPANRGDVIQWSTRLREGATIAPLQEGLTILNRTAKPGSPAVALATNLGYYQYDVYTPALEGVVDGGSQFLQVVAVLIVSEYKQGGEG